jgi:xylulokinase
MPSTDQLLLGIDIGTTATKAILADPEGRVVAEDSATSCLHSPRPGWAEEDPSEWWQNVCQLVPGLIREAKASKDAIAAVGVSGMVPTLICLNTRGAPLRPSIQQNDARAIDEIEELKRKLAEAEILERTGSPVTQQSIGPKVLWLRRHEPEVVGETAAICGSYDFVVRRLLGGGRSTEANWALESGLYDLKTESWAPDICAASATEESWLGDVRWPSEVVGEVGSEEATGLRPGTPVVAGSADHVASAFSAGVLEEGDLLVKLGGAGDILFASEEPVVDERLFLDYHLASGKYLPNGCMAASGSVIRWFQEHLAGGASLEVLDREAEEAGVGAGGIVALPYFLGEKTPINDPRARGTFVGLHLGHRRGHLYRAILEAIAFGFAHHVEVLREQGLEPRRVRVTNGGSRSRVWKRIVADVLGLPLESILQHPGSSLGAAFAAGMGVGVFEEWAEIERFVRVDERIEPNEENHLRYKEIYRIYRSLYPALEQQQHALAGFGAPEEVV